MSDTSTNPTTSNDSSNLRKIIQLRDSSDHSRVYPLTLINAIHDKDGKSLIQYLNDALGDLNIPEIKLDIDKIYESLALKQSRLDSTISERALRYLNRELSIDLSHIATISDRLVIYETLDDLTTLDSGKYKLVPGTIYYPIDSLVSAAEYTSESGWVSIIEDTDLMTFLYSISGVSARSRGSTRVISSETQPIYPRGNLVNSGHIWIDTSTSELSPYIYNGSFFKSIFNTDTEIVRTFGLDQLLQYLPSRVLLVSSDSADKDSQCIYNDLGNPSSVVDRYSEGHPTLSSIGVDFIKTYMYTYLSVHTTKTKFNLHIGPSAPLVYDEGDIWIDDYLSTMYIATRTKVRVQWTNMRYLSLDPKIACLNLYRRSDVFDPSIDTTLWSDLGAGTSITTSNIVETIDGKYNVQQITEEGKDISQVVSVRPGKIYTYSAWMRSENTTRMTYRYSSGLKIVSSTLAAGAKINNEYQRYSVTFTTNEGVSLCDLRFESMDDSPYRIYGITLNEGAEDTGWSPSILDLLDSLRSAINTRESSLFIHRDSIPMSPAIGDLRIDGDTLLRSMTTGWDNVSTVESKLLIDTITSSYNTSGTTVVQVRPVPPGKTYTARSDLGRTELVYGDIWVDSKDYSVYRWDRTGWVSPNGTTITSLEILFSSGVNILRGTNTRGNTESPEWSSATFGDLTQDSVEVIEPTDPPVSIIEAAWSVTQPASSSDERGIYQVGVPCRRGETHTLSCYARSKGAGAILHMYYGSPQNAIGMTYALNTTWDRYQITFIAGDSDGNAVQNDRTSVYFLNSTVNSTIEICGMKLEVNPIATQYLPCPMDTNQSDYENYVVVKGRLSELSNEKIMNLIFESSRYSDDQLNLSNQINKKVSVYKQKLDPRLYDQNGKLLDPQRPMYDGDLWLVVEDVPTGDGTTTVPAVTGMMRYDGTGWGTTGLASSVLVEQTATNLQYSINNVQGNVDGIEDKLGAHFVFGTSGLTIGENYAVDSSIQYKFYTKYGPRSIEFFKRDRQSSIDTSLGSVSGDGFKLPNAEIGNALVFGNYAILPESDGSAYLCKYRTI